MVVPYDKEKINMNDYNQKYYIIAVKEFQNMRYYPGEIIQDCTNHIKRYYPDADEEEVKHAVNWALADTWNGGCEVEQI